VQSGLTGGARMYQAFNRGGTVFGCRRLGRLFVQANIP